MSDTLFFLFFCNIALLHARIDVLSRRCPIASNAVAAALGLAAVANEAIVWFAR